MTFDLPINKNNLTTNPSGNADSFCDRLPFWANKNLHPKVEYL